MLCSATVNVPTNLSFRMSRAGIQGHTVILLLAIMFCNARVTLFSIEWAVLKKMTDVLTFVAFQSLIWSLTVTLPETFCISKISSTTSRGSPSGRCKSAFVRKQCFISTRAIRELEQLLLLLQRRRRQLQKTIGLMIKTTALHVHHPF